MSDRLTFTAATAKGYTERGFDLVWFFDCLHDLGDPVGAAQHANRALNDDGTVLLVEPYAGATLAENSTPVGRLYYAKAGFSRFRRATETPFNLTLEACK